jgi:serine/threonine protein kinase
MKAIIFILLFFLSLIFKAENSESNLLNPTLNVACVNRSDKTGNIQHKDSGLADMIVGKTPVGKGTFGEVFEVTYNDRKAALKRIPVSKDHLNEVNTMSSLLGVSGVPRVFACEQDNDNIYLVQELLYKNLGTRSAVNLVKEKSLGDRLRIYRDFLKTVQELKIRELVHRDIKPENMMLKDDSANILYLIDFGIASHKSNFNISGSKMYFSPKRIQDALYNPTEADDYFAAMISLTEIEFGRGVLGFKYTRCLNQGFLETCHGHFIQYINEEAEDNFDDYSADCGSSVAKEISIFITKGLRYQESERLSILETISSLSDLIRKCDEFQQKGHSSEISQPLNDHSAELHTNRHEFLFSSHITTDKKEDKITKLSAPVRHFIKKVEPIAIVGSQLNEKNIPKIQDSLKNEEILNNQKKYTYIPLRFKVMPSPKNIEISKKNNFQSRELKETISGQSCFKADESKSVKDNNPNINSPAINYQSPNKKSMITFEKTQKSDLPTLDIKTNNISKDFKKPSPIFGKKNQADFIPQGLREPKNLLATKSLVSIVQSDTIFDASKNANKAEPNQNLNEESKVEKLNPMKNLQFFRNKFNAGDENSNLPTQRDDYVKKKTNAGSLQFSRHSNIKRFPLSNIPASISESFQINSILNMNQRVNAIEYKNRLLLNTPYSVIKYGETMLTNSKQDSSKETSFNHRV